MSQGSEKVAWPSPDSTQQGMTPGREAWLSRAIKYYDPPQVSGWQGVTVEGIRVWVWNTCVAIPIRVIVLETRGWGRVSEWGSRFKFAETGGVLSIAGLGAERIRFRSNETNPIILPSRVFSSIIGDNVKVLREFEKRNSYREAESPGQHHRQLPGPCKAAATR